MKPYPKQKKGSHRFPCTWEEKDGVPTNKSSTRMGAKLFIEDELLEYEYDLDSWDNDFDNIWDN